MIIAILILSIMIPTFLSLFVFLQGVPGEGGAPGAVGPRVSSSLLPPIFKVLWQHIYNNWISTVNSIFAPVLTFGKITPSVHVFVRVSVVSLVREEVLDPRVFRDPEDFLEHLELMDPR